MNSEQASENFSALRVKACNLCRQFLSGQWNNISPNEMTFRAVSGGLSNLLYYCSLPSGMRPIAEEPDEALLRIYGQPLIGDDTRINDSVIMMLLSERNLGPKLYGLFPGGRLEEYIPARSMVCNELADPILSAIIARKFAIVHRLNVPISKQSNFLSNLIDDWLKKIRNEEQRQSINPIERELCSFDLEAERDVLFKILAQCDSPKVFCHNDLQVGNILIPSDDKELATLIKNQKLEDRLVFIDFEFCSYNFRGFDLGNHFLERMFDYSNPEWPHFHVFMEKYPNDQEKRHFIRHYIEKSKELEPNNEQYDEDQIIREADFYALASHFTGLLWAMKSARSSTIPFGYWEFGKARLETYHQHKKYLFQTYDIKI